MKVFLFLVLTLCCCIGSLVGGAETGSLPGCRFVARDTPVWILPSTYRQGSDSYRQGGVCSTVAGETPYTFRTDESLYLQRDGRSRFTCPGDSTTTYCVTYNYEIVKCGDLACAQTRSGVDGCTTTVARSTCASLGAQSGPLPGCRYVYQVTNKWILPTAYRTTTSSATWRNGVCSTVPTTPTLRFGIDESIYILGGGRSNFTCPGDTTTTYCVTSAYEIVKCGEIGCAQTTYGINGCARPISRSSCALRRTSVSTSAALSTLNAIWTEVMEGALFWLNKFGLTGFLSIVQEINANKGIILEAISVEIESLTSVDANTFKTTVVNAIAAIVPAAGDLLPILIPIPLTTVIWDIMNWDIFNLKAW